MTTQGYARGTRLLGLNQCRAYFAIFQMLFDCRAQRQPAQRVEQRRRRRAAGRQSKLHITRRVPVAVLRTAPSSTHPPLQQAIGACRSPEWAKTGAGVVSGAELDAGPDRDHHERP